MTHSIRINPVKKSMPWGLNFIGFSAFIYVVMNFYPDLAGVFLFVGFVMVMGHIFHYYHARHNLQAQKQMLIDFQWDPKMSPWDFEANCARYLGMKGWKTRTTKGSGDQGIDVFAQKEGIKIVLQCKLYSRPVGNKAVQEALAGKTFAGAHMGAVISNQRYTKSAHELAMKANIKLLHFTDLLHADSIFL